MIGLVLIAILVGYGSWPGTARELLGFAAASGLCLLLTLGVFLDDILHLSNWPEGQTLDDYRPADFGGWQSLMTWVVLAAIVYMVGFKAFIAGPRS